MTDKIQWEAIEWPEDMVPSRSPIHFTNELEVAASPETIWFLLVDPNAWLSFYPGVDHVQPRIANSRQFTSVARLLLPACLALRSTEGYRHTRRTHRLSKKRGHK
jgi:hypothetical protein